MNNNSIKIILYRKGGFEKPEYNITIYDDRKIVYEGLNNVKIKSKIETFISEDDVILILEELKSSKLFSINQKYSIDEGLNRSFTKITVEIQGLQGEIKTKTVIHYDDDTLIPNSLKIFENKIDEVVKSYRWVKTPSEEKKQVTPVQKPIIKKPVQDIPKKNNKKKIVKIAIPAVVGIILFLCLFFFVLLDTSDIVYDPPRILSLSVSDYALGLGDKISINFEYENITENITYKFSGKVNLYHEQNLVDSYSFYVNSSQEIVNNCDFVTKYSWPLGNYRVVFILKDEISGLTASDETYFTLYEKIPKINIFTTASSVSAYRVYTANSIFNINDTVFVYLEYTEIATTDDNTICDIILVLNVTSSNKKYYYSSINKTTVGNNSQMWWFELDSNVWENSKIYKADIDLYDRRTSLSASKSTSFYVS
jgi:hypothetical protein